MGVGNLNTEGGVFDDDKLKTPWVAYRTRDGKRTYYYNKSTGKTSWEQPRLFKKGAVTSKSKAAATADSTARPLSLRW